MFYPFPIKKNKNIYISKEYIKVVSKEYEFSCQYVKGCNRSGNFTRDN